MRNVVLATCAVLAGLCAVPAAAEPPAYPDFTFKRVKPPAPGAKKRITVQIDPAEQAARLRPPAPVQPDPPAEAGVRGVQVGPEGLQPWFWDDLPSGGAERLETALARLDRSGRIAAPRLDDLRRIADRHGPAILGATIGTRVSPALVLAVIAVESGGRSAAVSSAGASGLMQLMPDTAVRFDVADTGVAVDNIRGGTAYLDWLLSEFDGDALLALAGYNAGENAVKRNGGAPPYPETRAYVPKVLAAWKVARGLCLTPPQLISDGCVFMGKRAATRG